MLYYLHIPKTGGISIRSILVKAAEKNNKKLLQVSLVDDLTEELQKSFLKIDYLFGHLGTIPIRIPSCQYVITLRDPVRHLLSWYAHILYARRIIICILSSGKMILISIVG